MRVLAAVLSLVLTGGVAHAQDDERWARVEAAEKAGKEINDHDQSAWHVTDALMKAVPGARNLPIAYVTERVDAEHVRTDFLLMDGDKATVFFTGLVKGSDVVSTEDFSKRTDAASASPAQMARLGAVMAVRETLKSGICGKPINAVALPGDAPGETYVYALASETKSGVVQMGGHIRVTVGADGKIVAGSQHNYSASCISLEKTKDSVALMISLPPAISDVPTEIHVFKSLSHNIPFYVTTGTTMWEVDGGRIMITPPMPVKAN
jgi:hypothetical protein